MTVTVHEVNRSLVRTLSKPDVLNTLREWRKNEIKHSMEAELLTDFIDLVESGDLDG